MDPHRAAVHEEDWVARKENDAWRRRPFARTFDLLSSEYGWTDDQILDLTLERLRQVREVVVERHGEEERHRLRLKEQELQVLCSYIAGSAGHKDGVSSAARIRLLKPPDDEHEVKYVPYEKVGRLFGG